VPVPGEKPHSRGAAARQEPEATMLNFVNPIASGGRPLDRARQARLAKVGEGYATQQHDGGINTSGQGESSRTCPMENKTHSKGWLLWKAEAKIVISFIQRFLRHLRPKPMCISRLMCISSLSFRRLALHPLRKSNG
jgi:hypothetical protein